MKLEKRDILKSTSGIQARLHLYTVIYQDTHACMWRVWLWQKNGKSLSNSFIMKIHRFNFHIVWLKSKGHLYHFTIAIIKMGRTSKSYDIYTSPLHTIFIKWYFCSIVEIYIKVVFTIQWFLYYDIFSTVSFWNCHTLIRFFLRKNMKLRSNVNALIRLGP